MNNLILKSANPRVNSEEERLRKSANLDSSAIVCLFTRARNAVLRRTLIKDEGVARVQRRSDNHWGR